MKYLSLQGLQQYHNKLMTLISSGGGSSFLEYVPVAYWQESQPTDVMESNFLWYSTSEGKIYRTVSDSGDLDWEEEVYDKGAVYVFQPETMAESGITPDPSTPVLASCIWDGTNLVRLVDVTNYEPVIEGDLTTPWTNVFFWVSGTEEVGGESSVTYRRNKVGMIELRLEISPIAPYSYVALPIPAWAFPEAPIPIVIVTEQTGNTGVVYLNPDGVVDLYASDVNINFVGYICYYPAV